MDGRVTNIELAELWGISRQAISMLVARGKISKGSDGLFDLKQATLAYCSQLRDAAAGRAHEVSEAKMCSLRAGASLKDIQTQLAQVRLDRETKTTVDRSEVLEAMHRLSLNVRHWVLMLPIKIKAALQLDVDAEETITVICHDVLTELAKGAVTLNEGIGYCQKPADELTEDDVAAMSPAEFRDRKYDPDFARVVDAMIHESEVRDVEELFKEAERSAALAVPNIPVRRGANGNGRAQ
jgi:phage terminase Nu1 subunit (DNA packaging protein)